MKKRILFFLLLSTSIIFSQKFSLVDRTINEAIADSIFPGATLLIGNEDGIIYKNAYGNFRYDSTSTKVKENTIYDLASVTKAFGTTFCVMKLVDMNKLNIEKHVSFYLPKFAANEKENITVTDLLIHKSGLPSYYPPKKGETKEHILDTIKALHLSYPTGSKTVYSCLNFVTTMMVVESIIDKPMYKFYAENFTAPLGMERTMFNPNNEIKKLCAPTTPELQGVVHDPLARGLGGLSGNAGLFSTTEDLSKLCQLLLNKGVYNGKRYLSEKVVTRFTKRYSPNNSRALGFDTRSEHGGSSSGKYFNNGTYGHLGYTGTSIWIDPVKKIYAILLTNRVYPDDTASIKNTRPKIYDAVILSLEK